MRYVFYRYFVNITTKGVGGAPAYIAFSTGFINRKVDVIIALRKIIQVTSVDMPGKKPSVWFAYIQMSLVKLDLLSLN